MQKRRFENKKKGAEESERAFNYCKRRLENPAKIVNMRRMHHLLHVLIFVSLAPYKVLGASLSTASGIFNLSDKAVHGLGAYSINNGTVEIGIKLVIDVPTTTLKGKTTATITSRASPSEFSSEEQIGLATHNMFRQVHEAPMMTLDRQMCNQAKSYAQKLAQMGTLEHSSNQEREGQGKNLSMGCSTNKAQAMEEAVTNWYNEVCDPGYNFNNGGFSGGTGHFTQVVWKGSTVLGIGRAEGEKRGMKCAYIVGRYKPAGNLMGQFEENVLKGIFNATYCSKV